MIKINYFGVYSITNKINNMRYIGKTMVKFSKRWSHHYTFLKQNKHNNKYLQNAWNKYGKDNFQFEIIEKFDIGMRTENNYNELNKMICSIEKQMVDFYKNQDGVYNLTDGGEVIPPQCVTEDVRKIVGQKNRERMTGSKLSEETKRKMSESHKGKKFSESHIEKIRKHRTGVALSEETKDKLRKANQGSNQKTSIYTEEIIYNIRVDVMNGYSQKELMEKYKIKQGTLYGILRHVRWKHVVPDGWLDFLNK